MSKQAASDLWLSVEWGLVLSVAILVVLLAWAVS